MARDLRANPSRAAARVGTLVIVGMVALALLVGLFSSWRTIEPGYVGIVFDKASRQVTNTLDPGWVFINPFTQSITRYPIGVQTLVMVQTTEEGVVKGDDSVKVGSREGQTMNADVSVQYSVSRDSAAQLYQTWAGAPIQTIEDNLVRQVTRSALNDIASQYGWEEIFGEKRVEYTQKVSAELQRRFGEKFVKFESLNLRGWHLTQNLQTALDAKIAAQQAAEQQAFALRQAQIKAEQDKVVAEGEANALRARAQGEADATKIRAAAQAEANKQLAESLTPDLIRYQQLQRWDGKLPVFSGGGVTPLIDASSIISGTAGQ
jgi:regulator of protease activity HflC (stomatin/prohibitin superfamily)